jgi:hypothetical protein
MQEPPVPGDPGEVKMRPTNTTTIKLTVTAGAALATLLVGGCAGMPTGNRSAEASADVAEIESEKAERARREEALARRQSELEAEQKRLEEARKELEAEAAALQTSASDDANSLMPPDPQPGECYARVIVPAKYETVSERVLKREASESIKIVPAEYQTVEETVVVQEASTRLKVVPGKYETVTERVLVEPAIIKLEPVDAVFETVEERVLVKPAITKTIEIPAVYKTVQEQVLVQPARTEWKRVADLGSSGTVGLSSATPTIQRYGDYKVLETRVEDTGELMCLVEIPAVYKTISKEVLVTPATTRTETISEAVYDTVTRKVEIEPATTREIVIPARYRVVETTREVRPETTIEVPIDAVYDTVLVTRMVEPEREVRNPIPAEYETLTRNNKISDERAEWRPVLCEVNMTRENVSALQTALNEAGSCRCGPNRNACVVDGIIGPCTLNAAERFARRNGLSSGNKYVTMDVVRALGLKF